MLSPDARLFCGLRPDKRDIDYIQCKTTIMNHKILILGLLIVAASVTGCMSSVDGTYIHEDKPDEYLILGADRTYFVHQEDSFGGSYRIDRNNLYLLVPLGSLKLRKDDNVWIDADGDRWIKK